MKTWTKDEEEFVKACCEMGWFYVDIANELDRSRLAIEHKAMRINTSNNKKTKLKTTEQYKKELKIKCPTIVCLEEYIRFDTQILHECLKCGSKYKSTPESKLKGNACKHCGCNNNGGDIPLDKEGIVYLVYIPKYDLYKIGITSKSTQERMRDNRLSKYEIILEHKFDTGTPAINLEKQWKSNLKHYLVNTGLLNSGNTETFRI